MTNIWFVYIDEASAQDIVLSILPLI